MKLSESEERGAVSRKKEGERDITIVHSAHCTVGKGMKKTKTNNTQKTGSCAYWPSCSIAGKTKRNLSALLSHLQAKRRLIAKGFRGEEGRSEKRHTVGLCKQSRLQPLHHLPAMRERERMLAALNQKQKKNRFYKKEKANVQIGFSVVPRVRLKRGRN